jgi:putative FmdB family regulatory protein
MPMYEFQCQGCKKTWEELCRIGQRSNMRCPDCGAATETVVSSPRAVIFTNPKGTSKEEDFDYVARWNLENAKEIRRRAEAAAGGAKSPYNSIDDISSGEFFGGVQ